MKFLGVKMRKVNLDKGSLVFRFFEYFCNFYFCYSEAVQCKTSNKKLTPFVGTGIGMTLAKQEEVSLDSDGDGINDTTVKPRYESSFVYEIQAGAKYKLSEKFDLFSSVAYRYLPKAVSVDSAGSITEPVSNTSLPFSVNESGNISFLAAKVGVQYNF